MKKLTRYTSFDDLKSHKTRNDKPITDYSTRVSKFKEFIDILRENVTTKKITAK